MVIILNCLFLGCNPENIITTNLSTSPSIKETIELKQKSKNLISSTGESQQEELKTLLREGEVLIRIQSTNLDDDINDEYLAIVTATPLAPIKDDGPAIKILIFDFIPTESEYQRIGELKTHATDIRTFDLQTQDLTGDHRLEILAQGVNSGGETTLDAFRLVPTPGSTIIYSSIASIVTKGTIEVSSRKFSKNYLDRGLKAEPLPITVYANNRNAATTIDVIKTIYIWKNKTNSYENETPVQVTESSIPAELQDLLASSGAEKFKNFLSGPWERISEKTIGNPDIYKSEIIHFEPDHNFITLYDGQVQEIYTWAVSYRLLPNRLGIWVNNTSVNSIEKSLNIEISDSNTIRIVIKGRDKDDYTDNMYSRLSEGQRERLAASAAQNSKLSTVVLSGWYFSDNGESILFDPPWFSWNLADGNISGGFAVYSINDEIIVFKILSPTGITREFRTYKMYYRERTYGQQLLRTFLLKPTHLTIHGAVASNIPPLRFKQLLPLETTN